MKNIRTKLPSSVHASQFLSDTSPFFSSLLGFRRERVAVIAPVTGGEHSAEGRIAPGELALDADAHRYAEEDDLDLYLHRSRAVELASVRFGLVRLESQAHIQLYGHADDAEHAQFAGRAEESGDHEPGPRFLVINPRG